MPGTVLGAVVENRNMSGIPALQKYNLPGKMGQRLGEEVEGQVRGCELSEHCEVCM